MRKLTLALLASVLLLAAEPVAQVAAISFRVTVDGVNTDSGAFTAKQVRLMNRSLTDFNAARTANGQATITMGVYLRGIIANALREQVETPSESHEQAEACAAYLALGAAARNAIDAQLGNKSPCR